MRDLSQKIESDVRTLLQLPGDAKVDVKIQDADADGLPEITVYVMVGEIRVQVLDVEMRGSVREALAGLISNWRAKAKARRDDRRSQAPV